MKCVVMSDSHGDIEALQKIKLEDADAYFHCGDSELTYDDPLLQHVQIVRGNCDRDHRFPNSLVTSINSIKILQVHGHLENVNASLINLYYKAKEVGASIVLFGHTHRYDAEMIDHILFVNPGSVVQPRMQKEKTFAIIEVRDTIQVSFIGMDGQLVEAIDFEVK